MKFILELRVVCEILKVAAGAADEKNASASAHALTSRWSNSSSNVPNPALPNFHML